MKMFICSRKRTLKIAFLFFGMLFFFNACTSYKTQIGNKTTLEVLTIDDNDLVRQIILIGDAGNAFDTATQAVLKAAENKAKASSATTDLIFLGDNIYPKGMPKKEHPTRSQAELTIKNQLHLAQNINGKTIFIPGNHDWYRGKEGLKRQADFVEEALKDNKSFFPGKNCGLDHFSLSDEIEIVIVDSKWFLQDWTKFVGLNDNCDIKTRADFFEEFKSLINKNQNKIVLVAMHHPLISNGPHGGKLSARQQLFPYRNVPLPILGSLVNFVRIKGGASPEDLHHKKYQDLIDRMMTILKDYPNAIVVSGHEHNLQWIHEDGIQQIVSGSGSKIAPARVNQNQAFSASKRGFALLQINKKNEVLLSFFGHENQFESPLFSQKIVSQKEHIFSFESEPPTTFTTASVYPKAKTQKSKTYQWLWGTHYREHFGIPVRAKTLILDTLDGGLAPNVSGGGNQSMSLRLKNPSGREYTLRAVEKNPTQFLQTALFQNQYVKTAFENTFAASFIADYYTTSHPFTPFILETFTKKLSILHTEPQLFYVPKQAALGIYNENYGDGLYQLEKRPSKSNADEIHFGNCNDIISTNEMIANIRKDESHQVDEQAFLKARLFDMFIGDWDRHSDQWRWAVYESKKQTRYQPIPRDRDQAFAKVDGVLLGALKNLPALRHIQDFSHKMATPRWINKTAFPLDVLLLKNTQLIDWVETATSIEEMMTDALIDEAFGQLPAEVQDETIEEIKQILKSRRAQLKEYAVRYFKEIRKYSLIIGTDKDDLFEIEPQKNSVTIQHLRKKKSGNELIFTQTYSHPETKEIWIYGLDDSDNFVCKTKNNSGIKIRLIGGLNEDSYDLIAAKNIKIYDFKSEKSNVAESFGARNTLFTNDYEINTFLYEKAPIRIWSTLPNAGFNPDDGVKLGFKTSLKNYRFIQKPFSASHQITVNFSTATLGVELLHQSLVPLATSKWNFDIATRLTNSSFAVNYFGFGNETQNADDTFSMDYNRVRMQIYTLQPGLLWKGNNGSLFSVGALFESLEVEETNNRFVNQPNAVNPEVFKTQQFSGATMYYDFQNFDNHALPTNGLGIEIKSGWKTNLATTEKQFFYAESHLKWVQKLNPSGKWIVQNQLQWQWISNNNFEFYQGATLGANRGLRAYRNERFLGRSVFSQSTDIRTQFGEIKKSFVPMKFGMIAGFDLGRVWLDQEDSKLWHYSAGGGLWLSAIDMAAAQINLFHGREGWRFTFGFNLDF